MNCCNNHDNHSNDNLGKRKGVAHKILMLLCCLAMPAAIILIALNRAGTISLGGSILPYFLILLCPLSHLLMMPLMHRRRENESLEARPALEDGNQQSKSCH